MENIKIDSNNLKMICAVSKRISTESSEGIYILIYNIYKNNTCIKLVLTYCYFIYYQYFNRTFYYVSYKFIYNKL